MLVVKHSIRVVVSTGMECYRWRGWCKLAAAAFYVVVFMVVLPVLIYNIASHEDHGKDAAWFVAGLFVLLTLPVFLVGLVQHILNYTQPHLQKHIIRYTTILYR